MKISRIVVFFMVAALAIAFVACSDDDPANPPATSSSATASSAAAFDWPTGVTYGNANATGYTFTNFDFNGGIKAVSDLLWAGSTLSTTTTITGVVTYVDSYYGDTCFIQDKDAALYLYGSGIAVKPIAIGDKISVTVSASGAYGQAPQVTTAALVQKISTGNALYLRTDLPADAEGKSLLRVFKGVVKANTGRGATVTVGAQEIDLYTSSYEGASKVNLPTELEVGKNVLIIGPAHAKDGRTQVLITSRNQLAIW